MTTASPCADGMLIDITDIVLYPFDLLRSSIIYFLRCPPLFPFDTNVHDSTEIQNQPNFRMLDINDVC